MINNGKFIIGRVKIYFINLEYFTITWQPFFYQLTGFSLIILEYTVVCTLSLLVIKVCIREHNTVH